MTESEAIKKLRQHFEYLKHVWKPHPDYETMDAIGYAIKALEKQIPKKPEYEAYEYADEELVYDYAKCPICGHDFEYGINDWGCEYCSDCGQKLNWESDEE